MIISNNSKAKGLQLGKIYKINSKIFSFKKKYLIIFSLLTPELLNRFVHACADAPAPFTTIFTVSIFFLEISKAFIKAAVVIIAVPC